MLQLHQLRVKLANAIGASDADLIKATVDELFEVTGNCEKCYGRGYLIANETGQLCDCERAERLKNFIERYYERQTSKTA